MTVDFVKIRCRHFRIYKMSGRVQWREGLVDPTEVLLREANERIRQLEDQHTRIADEQARSHENELLEQAVSHENEIAEQAGEDAMREEKNQLATALEGAQARVQELESLRTEEANRYQNETNAHKREIKKLKKKTAKASKENASFKAAIEAKTKSIRDITAELETVKAEKSQTEGSLDRANAKIEEVEALSTGKNNAIWELEQKLNVIRQALEQRPQSGYQRRRRSSSRSPRSSRHRSRSRSRSRSPRDYRSRSRSRSPRERAHSEVSRASSSRERPQSRSRSRSRPRSGRADTATALDSGTTP